MRSIGHHLVVVATLLFVVDSIDASTPKNVHANASPVMDARFWATFTDGFVFTSRRDVSTTPDKYDDALCAEQFNQTIDGVTKAERWALKCELRLIA